MSSLELFLWELPSTKDNLLIRGLAPLSAATCILYLAKIGFYPQSDINLNDHLNLRESSKDI